MAAPAIAVNVSTDTHITSPRLIQGLRVAWVLLLLFYGLQLPVRIPAYLENCNCPTGTVALWQATGIETGVRILFVISASVQLLVAFGLSLLLMMRRGSDRNAVLFAFIFLMMSGGAFPANDALPGAGWQFIENLVLYLRYLAFAGVFYLFPDGRFAPPRIRYLFFILPITLLAIFLPPDNSIRDSAVLTMNLVMFSGGLGSLIYRYRKGTPIRRQQIKWLLLILMLIVGYLSFALPLQNIMDMNGKAALTAITDILLLILVGCIPVAISLALFRYRLFEIDLVINRSLVYGTVTLGLLAVFAFLFYLRFTVLSVIAPPEQITGLMFLSAVVSGAVFNPLRRSIQRLIDRRFYGLRFDLNELAAAQKPTTITTPGAFTGRSPGGYVLLDVIGRGGMGEVYRAENHGQSAAVKILPLKLAEDEEFIRRFEREAQTTAALQHPGIVKLYNSGIEDDLYYIALELVTGETLKDCLQQQGRFSLSETQMLISTLAAALDYAHTQGIVHRDLKPSNIMLRNTTSKNERSLIPVLMDFGVAHLKDAHTALTGSGAIGTIDYMAPEQILEAKAVQHYADIYALGIIAYEMLTGERPFKGSAAQVMFAHLQQPPPDPRLIAHNLPEQVALAVLQAMDKTPEKRFQSAGNFAAALQ